MQHVSNNLANGLRWLTVFCLAVTVSLIPWILGGVVPVATFVLLTGSILAGVFATLYQIVSTDHGKDLPKILAPVLGLAIIGFWHLTPAAEPAASILTESFETLVEVPTESLTSSHSFSPADTRTRTAIYLSLALLSVSAFQTVRTPTTIGFLAVSVIINGLTMGVVGMTLKFQQQSFSWNELWSLEEFRFAGARGFAAFINPNGAGGWLCLAFATSAGWLHWHLQKKATDPKLRRGRLRISWFGRTWQRALEFLAELTVWQILSITALTFLAAAVAATKSRGAIGAMLGAVALTVAMKSSFRTLPFVLAFVMAAGGLTYALLQSLELSQEITTELDTLRDYDTAVGVRPEHWRDALHAWRQSPLLGAGHGSYRFATLPFSTNYHRTWFRNADNQYVETLVEAGLIGLVLFILIGWIGIRVSTAATRQAKSRNKQKDKLSGRPSRRILAGLGTAIILAIFAQAVAATVDFGIGMPPASSLLILMIAVLSGYLNASPDSEPSKLAGTIRCSKIFSVCISLMLLVASTGFVKDQWHAISVDQQVVAAHRRLLSPIKVADLEQVRELKLPLISALENRPDDPEGLRMLSRLLIADFRWETLLRATNGEIASDETLNKKWNDWTLFHIAERLEQIGQDAPLQAQQLRTTLNDLLESQQIPATLQTIQQRFPHLLGIPLQRAVFATIMEDKDTFRRQARLSRTIDPSNAKKLFELGLIAADQDLPEMANDFWQESLKFSNQFRWAVLSDATRRTNASEAMNRFGPQSYEDCFETVQKIRIPELKDGLWQRAEELWATIEQPASEAQCQLRLRHLQNTNRSVEVLIWLKSALEVYPDSVPLRVEYARQLANQGQYRKALGEWQRVLYLDPENRIASKSIFRLKNLK